MDALYAQTGSNTNSRAHHKHKGVSVYLNVHPWCCSSSSLYAYLCGLVLFQEEFIYNLVLKAYISKSLFLEVPCLEWLLSILFLV
jgi:hypothetical protein